MTAGEYPRYFPLGDRAVTVEFGDRISEQLNELSTRLAYRLNESPFPGYVESVPAYASTTIFYDPAMVRLAFPQSRTTYVAVQKLIEAAITGEAAKSQRIIEPIVIPVDFSASSGLDLESVAVSANLTVDEVISMFTSSTYRVYMLGFLPGFPYMGQVDEQIAMPRKATPRASVPRGSVGIAGRQTGIYPFESPGGWQIIGRTDRDMFRPDAQPPCLLKPGDRVQFARM